MGDEFFRSRSIDCDGLPDHIKQKAQSIIEELESGKHFSKLKGHRMFFDRNKISIPVTFTYRILAKETKRGLIIQSLVSHETYNKLIKKR